MLIPKSMLFLFWGDASGVGAGSWMSGVSANCRFSYKRIEGKGSFLISISNAVEVSSKVYVFYTGSRVGFLWSFLIS